MTGQEFAHPRFELLSRLGRGATGVVFHARDRTTLHEVALKTLHSAGPAGLYGLKHEFRALAGINHRNLVQLYELFVEHETCFFTMELVRGLDFREFIRPRAVQSRGSPLGSSQQERLRSALVQLCNGLEALHSQGKLHRDVKPSNVLVEDGGRVVLLDFGFVSDLDSSLSRISREGGPAGTLSYMAPEVLWGEHLSSASDWYSVGVLLYECLTGHLPVDPAAENALVRPRDFVPPPPSRWVRETPTELDALVQALLDPDPANRPSGAEVRSRIDSSPGHPGLSSGHRAVSADLAPSRSEDGPFVGRREEMERLRRALRAVVAGSAQMVRIHGQSGIGKTALIEKFLSSAEAVDEVLAIRARCHPNERVPFKAIDGLIDQLSR